MKRIIFILIFCLPLIAFSQIEKGNVLLSGNVSYEKNTTAESTFGTPPLETTQVEVSPYVGYFVSSRFAVGIYASYVKSEQKLTPTNPVSFARTSDKTYSVGPFVRYYHPISEKFYLFAQGDVAFGNSTATYTFADPDINPQTYERTIKTTVVAIRPGVAYYLTKRVALELILGSVSYSKSSYSNSTNQNTDDLNGFTFKFITRGLSPGITFTF